MRRLAFLAISCSLALAAVSFADTDVPGATRVWTETQLLTRPIPDAGQPTLGMSLQNVSGFRVTVCAQGSQILDAGGYVDLYLWDNDIANWVSNPALTQSITAAGAKCQTFPDYETLVSSGRVLAATRGAVVYWNDAGTQHVETYIKARTPR